MKRIYSQVAVATLLSTMSPKHKVQIIDVDPFIFSGKESWDNISSKHGKIYLVDHILHNVDYVKISRAAIHHAFVNDKGMVGLVIDTRHEEY